MGVCVLMGYLLGFSKWLGLFKCVCFLGWVVLLELVFCGLLLYFWGFGFG